MNARARLLIAAALLAAHGAAGAQSPAEAALARALGHYEIGHYQEALREFERAAELGSVRSGEMLVLMYRYGERLYGDQVRRDPGEAARWGRWLAERLTASAAGATSP